MVTYKNVIRHLKMPFEDYLSIEGYSHSHLKMLKDGIRIPVKQTVKIQLGKVVDELITNPDFNEFDIGIEILIPAKAIVEILKSEFGYLFNLSKAQVSYEGDVYDDDESFYIHSTGRLDFQLGKCAVIDLKINNDCSNAADVDKMIQYMGYDNALFHYANFGNIQNKYLIVYSTKAKRAFVMKRLTRSYDILLANKWWNDKIHEYGKIASNVQ